MYIYQTRALLSRSVLPSRAILKPVYYHSTMALNDTITCKANVNLPLLDSPTVLPSHATFTKSVCKRYYLKEQQPVIVVLNFVTITT